MFTMSDPREIRNSDPYAELSDDEEDIENGNYKMELSYLID